MELNLKTDLKSKNLIQNDSIFYIFEIYVRYIDNTYLKLRRVKNCKYGDLIYLDDKIKNNISKIKILVFDLNDPLNKITIKKKLTNKINEFLFINNNSIIFNLVVDEATYITSKYRFLN
jgi:hypothetical protein